MKLLFDENVSPRLAEVLADEYPGSTHVRSVGLRGTDDRRIWDYARDQSFAIVSKDTDFRERSFGEGFPPKIVWLDVGNASTVAIAELLRRERHRVERFEGQTKRRYSFSRLERARSNKALHSTNRAGDFVISPGQRTPLQ